MKKMLVWSLLLSKRLFKRPSFILILLLLPVVLIAYRYILTEDSDTLRVALYCEESDEFSGEIIDALTESDSFATYYRVSSEEEAVNDVAASRAECAYIFSEDLEKAVLEKDYDDTITVFSSDNTQYKALINEEVFCAVYHGFSDDVMVSILLDYEKEQAKEDPDYEPLGEEAIRELLAERRSARETDMFTFYYIDGKDTEHSELTTEENTEEMNYLTRPIRGTVALFVLLSGLAGLVFWFQDNSEGRFNAFAYYKRPLLSLGSLFLPVMLAGVMGLVCIFLSGIGKNPFFEIAMMLLYMLLTTGFCNLLRLFLPSVNTACATIPILVLTSYICAPVILDISPHLPAIRYVRVLLTVNYYLQTFISSSMIPQFVLASLLLLPVTVLLDYMGRFGRKLV